MGRILVADDHDALRRGLARGLTEAGHEVEEASNGNAAIERLHDSYFDVVLSDLKMGGSDGMDVLRTTRAMHPTTAVILMTAFGSVNTAVEAMKIGAFDYVQKPFEIEEMEVKIDKALEVKRLKHELDYLRGTQQDIYEFDKIVGSSPALQHVLDIVKKVAKSNTTVLIRGETGTGKELIAGATHHNSLRSARNFVKVNCAALQENLLESELFGHEKGAFTGADKQRIGRFEQADGGTLFLDEIGNLDPDLQRQLLLVLERGTVTRLGDVRPRPAAPRLIAATNQDLAQLVRDGRFRHDLYMRLNPATRLRVPALRDRREDLPDLVRFALLDALRSDALRPLVRAYLARFPTPEDFRDDASAVVVGKPQAARSRRDGFTVFLSSSALQRLGQHDWPGNHRELKLFASNSLVFALAQHLDADGSAGDRAPAILSIPDALVDQLLGSEPAPRKQEARAASAVGELGRRVEVMLKPGHSFAEISADVERQYLVALFRAFDGDLSRIARELFGAGADRRKVHLRMNQLGLRLRELRGAQG